MEDVGIMVDMRHEHLVMPELISTLLEECSAITDYRILRDSLPKRLAHLLKCRAVLFYQKIDETLQFVSGTYDDRPGWSSALLSVVHINPVHLDSDVTEVRAFVTRRPVCVPTADPTLIAVPLMYRQRVIGVMVAIRGRESKRGTMPIWKDDDVQAVEGIAGVVALLLENTRLLERDKERIHELSLLNSISSQLNHALHDTERLHSIILQQVRETTGVDLCDLLGQTTPLEMTPWISPTLRDHLFTHFNEQSSSLPLLIERSGAAGHLQDAVVQLPSDIKTFFAFPLLRPMDGKKSTGQRGARGSRVEQRVLGIVVGAYYRASRLRREEIALLQVISSQAGAALENMRLVADVTEARNEARKLLRRVLEDQRFKELVFESIPSGLITMDMRGRITTFNRAATTILGYQPREVVGQSLYMLLTTSRGSAETQEIGGIRTFSSASSLRPASLRTPANTIQHGTLVTQNRRGQEIVLEVDVLPLRDERGNQVGAVITFTDMTSVHRLEEEKRRLDRLASLGEMAANVAHEVRNPLASIKVSIQMLMDDFAEEFEEHTPQEEPQAKLAWAQESTSVVLKEVERLDAIVRDLLLFARPRQLHRTSCSLSAVSDHVLHLLQTQCTEANVTVCRDYDTVLSVLADASQVEQILFNLFTNAIQAMPEGGTLTVSCRPAEMRTSDDAQHGQATVECKDEPQWFELQVTDTGVGIPGDQLERIFQPFFTTKAHGIGLGLSITRRLLEDHGGSLRVESRVGCGSTVSLRLPLYNEQLENEGRGHRDVMEEGVREDIDEPGNSHC
jgi:PAS domain S-box-containing protein